MSTAHRFSVSLKEHKGAALRALVDNGTYPTLSSAFDAAVDTLLEQEKEREAWWEEIKRRCDEAEAHPERLEDYETFFRKLHEEINALKASRRA